jgi:murein DD-endopeptidase MepM/ murein hydrolase activator NlpD
MMEFKDTFLYRLWFLTISVLVAANLLLVSFNLSTAQAIGINPGEAYSKLSLKSHMAPVKHFFDGAIDGVGGAINSTVHTAVSVARVPGRVALTVSKPASLVGVVRPAATDKTPPPTINSSPAQGMSAISAATAAAQATHTKERPRWPIHGIITTYFGVPEMPYESVHTGLDISDGKPPGVSPVKPFLSGVVIAAVQGGGLGNHVIIDHGGGLTSVYGHLYSLSVHVGEKVGQNTTLGYEGSTGVSTGTHLHFEIRVHDQPENPLNFIRGHP